MRFSTNFKEIFVLFSGGRGIYSVVASKSHIFALIRRGVFSRRGEVFSMNFTVILIRKNKLRVLLAEGGSMHCSFHPSMS